MEAIQEKRRFVRLNALVDVIYNRVSLAETEKLSLSKNISKGGICLIAYERLEVSDLLKLDIHLPGEAESVNARGRVAWVKEFVIGDIPNNKRYDVGIEFVKINAEDLRKIDKYIFVHIS